MLEITAMKTNFWFFALSPFIGAAVGVVAAAAMIGRSLFSSSQRARRKHLGRLLINIHELFANRVDRNAAVRFGTLEMALGVRAGLRENANHR